MSLYLQNVGPVWKFSKCASPSPVYSIPRLYQDILIYSPRSIFRSICSPRVFFKVFVHQEYFLKYLFTKRMILPVFPMMAKSSRPSRKKFRCFENLYFISIIHNNEICVFCCFVWSWETCQLHNVMKILWFLFLWSTISMKMKSATSRMREM